ncbi:MAG: tetratricopeptide repeat protein [Desulfobacteraceae bacterium]|nr:tetratricopeptide repeat protein [Desulfobacteraceae bacterium]
MTDFCTYHPTQPAWWRCPNCAKSLCPQCIVRRKGGYTGNENLFFCPKCNIPATQVDTSNIVTPFWKRLHKCFVYPFSSIQSIFLIFGMALLSALFSKAGFLGGLLRFIPWALMVKYSFEALRATAAGRFRPPPITVEGLTDNLGLVFKQIALFVALLLFFAFFITRMNPFFWILFGVCVLIGLPAMIIILAINDDLGQALNPVYFLGMTVRIGWGYLLLLFFLSILITAPSVLGYAVIRHMPEATRHFFWLAANNYYTLVTYHLMGCVILQYHEQLSYPVDFATLLASTYPAALNKTPQSLLPQTPAAALEHNLLNDIAPLIQEGDLDGAIALIKKETDLQIHDLQLSDRYINLLKMRHRDQEFQDYAPKHLELLVKAGEKDKALELYTACAASEGFAAPPTTLFKIGGWFSEKGNPKMAVQTFNHLTKVHPQDVLIPKVYYRAAQILHEKLANTEKAKKILTALISKYPDHEIANFARTYLRGI